MRKVGFVVIACALHFASSAIADESVSVRSVAMNPFGEGAPGLAALSEEQMGGLRGAGFFDDLVANLVEATDGQSLVATDLDNEGSPIVNQPPEMFQPQTIVTGGPDPQVINLPGPGTSGSVMATTTGTPPTPPPTGTFSFSPSFNFSSRSFSSSFSLGF